MSGFFNVQTMEEPRIRAGRAAEVAAARRRAGEAAAARARAQLATYWDKHKVTASGIGLPQRLQGSDYYSVAEDQARMLARERHKQSRLEERRSRLAIIFFNEDLQYQEEMKTNSVNARYLKKSTLFDNAPTELLRNINLGIKAKEEERQLQEAEIKLYHQWKINNPVIQKFEKAQRNSALKSAWMEQIIESEKLKREEEVKQQILLQEREKKLKKEVEKEKEDLMVKNKKIKDLNEYLSHQINELQESENSAKMLKIQLEAEENLMCALEEAQILRKTEALRRAASRRLVLGNMGLYARKIRERAKEAEMDVEADQNELKKLIMAIEKEAFNNDVAKKVWKEALDNTFKSFERQKDLEKLRQKNLQDAMDGEAKAIFEKQNLMWQKEHLARQELLREVIVTLKAQVKLKLDEYKQQQKENILNREMLLADIEKSAKIMAEQEAEKKRYEQGLSKMAALQNQIKQIEREEKQMEEKKIYENEIRDAAQEEERLRNEIIKLQREGCGFQNYRRKNMNW